MNLRAVLEYDDVCKAWAIYCPELPGLTSCGDNEAEAVTNFREAVELFFAHDEDELPADVKVLEMVV